MQTFLFESDAGANHVVRWTCELEDVRAAQLEAVKTIGELLAQDGPEFWNREAASMSVSDENGLILFRLDLSAGVGPARTKR